MSSPQYLVVFWDDLSQLWELTEITCSLNSLNCDLIFESTTLSVAEIAADVWPNQAPQREVLYQHRVFSNKYFYLSEVARHGTQYLKLKKPLVSEEKEEKEEKEFDRSLTHIPRLTHIPNDIWETEGK